MILLQRQFGSSAMVRYVGIFIDSWSINLTVDTNIII